MSELSQAIEERELIKSFTTDFNKINDGVNERIVSTMNRLNITTTDELNTNTSLKSLDDQINSLVLANTLKNLVAIKNNIVDKYKEFNDITAANTIMTSKINNSIKENKQVIDGIYKTVSVINENLRNINEVIDKYDKLPKI
jgi:DNA-binding ferritin-like protein